MSRIVNIVRLRAGEQGTVFDGTRNSAIDLGLTEYRLEERVAAVDQPAWADVPRQEFYGYSPTNRVAVGTMFTRQLISLADGTETYGPWVAEGQASQLADEWAPINITRDREAAPGQPMRRPDGTDLILPDGTQPLRPLSGEQDLDPLTGELLFEADGVTPVLVPVV